MVKHSFSSIFLAVIGLWIIYFFPMPLPAQVSFSPFADAAVARVAGTGIGFDLNANPAFTAQFPMEQRFQLIIKDIINDEKLNLFDRRLPDFSIKFAITSKISLSMAKSELEPWLTSTAREFDAGFDPPFHSFYFSWLQDWSAGLGFRFNHQYTIGLALRHEVYRNQELYYAFREFRTYDLGIMRYGDRLQLGLIIHNFLTEDLSPALRKQYYNYQGQTFTGEPMDFPGIFNKPPIYGELGLNYLLHQRFRTLAELSSRGEAALGWYWRMVYKIHLSAGYGYRFDRIFNEKPVSSGAIGLQFQDQPVAIAINWIFALGAAERVVKDTRWGKYQFVQNQKYLVNFGLGFSF